MKMTRGERLGDLSRSYQGGSAGQAIDRRTAIGLLCAVAVLGGCSILFPARYRYRMTMEVGTPSGARRGSSVHEISSRLQNVPGMGGPTPSTKFRGEAVAVNLPGGRTLFALVDPDGFDATGHFERYDGMPETYVANVAKLGRGDQRGRTVVLPPDEYPRLVTFRDINDPTSVQAVEPADLAARFGPGMRLRRITLEITGDAVTTGIEKHLGWLDNFDSFRTDPDNPFTNNLPREIGYLRIAER